MKIASRPVHTKPDLFPELHCRIKTLIAWQGKLLTLLFICLFSQRAYILLQVIKKIYPNNDHSQETEMKSCPW